MCEWKPDNGSKYQDRTDRILCLQCPSPRFVKVTGTLRHYLKYVDYKITGKKIIKKKISEKEMDHVKSDSKEKVIGNIWIRDGKIVFLKTDIFPIDEIIIIVIAFIIEGIFFAKSKITREV